jgi:Fe-S cluster biogenesis protein NfuA
MDTTSGRLESYPSPDKLERGDIMQEDTQEQQQEHQQRADRIEFLVQKVSTFSDLRAREVTEELMQILLNMYGEGLARILELTVETEAAGYALIKNFTSDDLVASLLLLHGLHPIPLEERIIQALDEVRPYLKSHGGNVELISVGENSARLRLEGSCDGCPSSTTTLQSTIEEAIYKVAPDLDKLEVEGIAEPPRSPVRTGAPVTFIPRKAKVKGV